MIPDESTIWPRPRTVTDSQSATVAAAIAMSTEAPTICGWNPILPATCIAYIPV